MGEATLQPTAFSTPRASGAPALEPAAASSEADALITRIQGLLHDLDHHVPTLPEIARDLGYSERSLRRHLQSRHTSYAAILRDVRLRRAEQWLMEPGFTVICIAERLGYTEATNFRHAFRRWMGCSPQTFRALRTLEHAAASVAA